MRAADNATITLSSSGQVSPGLANILWGDPFKITATIVPDGSGDPELVIDGTVTFTGAATGPVTVAVVNGVAETSWQLPESAVFTATYQDGSTYAAPPSGQYVLAVLPVPVAVGYSVVPSTPAFAEPVSLAISVDPAVTTAQNWTRSDIGAGSIKVFRVPPTGDDVKVGEYVIDHGETTVALDLPAGVPMPAGSNDIRVEFSGDLVTPPGGTSIMRFAPGETTGSLSVAQTPATVQVAGPTTVAAGALPSYTVSVGPAAAAYPPTGIVQLLDGPPATGTLLGEWLLAPADAGAVSITLATPLAAGEHTLYATFDGATAGAADPNRLDGTSAPLSVAVAKAGQATLTITGPASATYGDPAFTPTTSGGSGAGAVTFTSTSPTVCTASSSATVTIVAAGTCTITATKAADTNFDATTSAPFPVAIGASTTTTLTCTGGCTGIAPSYSTAFLTSVTFRATVSPTSATGSVTFFDGATAIGTDTINGPGRATITSSALTTGDHTITAVYSGDATYGSSTSSAISLAVAKASQATLTITGPASATYGSADQAITTSGGSGTGAVTYDTGSSTACAIVASQLHVLSGTGTCTITATKAADTNFDATTSAPFPVAIGKTSTTTTLTCTGGCTGTAPSYSTTYQTPVTFAATLDPTAATGTVAFRDGATDIPGCSSIIASSGLAACTPSAALTGGPHTITAVYAGDASYGASTSAAVSLTVAKAGQATLTITGPASATYGDPAFTPTTSGGSGAGAVTFTSTSPTVCTASSSATVTIVAAGTCTITATKAADTNFDATTSAPFAVAIATAALGIAADPQSKTYGDPDPPLTFHITSGSLVGSDALTGALARAVGENVPGGYSISQGTLTAGSNYTISYVAASLAITQARLTGTANSKTRAYGVANPTLDVTYAGYKLGQNAGTAGITGSPTCSTTATTTSPVAAYPITCSFGTLAANNYTFAQTFTDGVLTVTMATSTTTIARSAASTTYGDTVTFTATVTPQAAGTATGSVEFRDGGAVVATLALDASRQATFVTSALGAGSHSLAAVYAGDSNVAGSTSATPAAVTVAKATATVAADAAMRPYGGADPTFHATITGFANGETLATSGITGSPACSTVALPSSVIGIYPITCAAGSLSSANYAYAFANGALEVTRAPLTVTAQDQVRPYGLPNPAVTFVVTGFANGENAASAGLTGAAACSTAAVLTTNVGAVPITCTTGTLAAANYAFVTFVPGNLTVQPAQAVPVVTSSTNPSPASEPVTFTARVAWPVGTPAGTVTFFEDGADVSGPLALVDGAASFTTSSIPLGDHAITATYHPANGVTNFVAASSPPFTQSVGSTTVDVELSAEQATWETRVPIRFVATPTPRASRVTVPVTGQVVFAVDGVDRATVAIVGGSAVYGSPALPAGAHTVTARYVRDASAEAYFSVGRPGTLARTVVANTINASGVGVSSSSIYPVADTWRDTVAIRGTRNERVSVAITIYSPTGARVRTKSFATGTGAYGYTWNGRTSRGTILAAGRYRVVQVLRDPYGASRTFASYVTLSRKRMYWYTQTITVSPGPRKFSAPGDAGIQAQFSTTRSTPLVMAFTPSPDNPGELAWKAVGYQFTLPSASTYKYVSFQVRGSWTSANGAPPKIGLIPWNGGSWLSMYSTSRARTAMGTSTTGYYVQTLTNLSGIRSGRYVRAAIDSFVAPTGWAPGAFRYSIASVRLVVRYGILR